MSLKNGTAFSTFMNCLPTTSICFAAYTSVKPVAMNPGMKPNLRRRKRRVRDHALRQRPVSFLLAAPSRPATAPAFPGCQTPPPAARAE